TISYGDWSSDVCSSDLGLGCNYVDSAIYLQGKSCVYGLPNLNQSYYGTQQLLPVSSFHANSFSGCPNTCFDFTNTSLNATNYQRSEERRVGKELNICSL